jgi:hypothetical protein
MPPSDPDSHEPLAQNGLDDAHGWTKRPEGPRSFRDAR